MTDYVRICPHCYLVYRPDARIHKNPDERCPRCGFKLIENDSEPEEVEDERNEPQDRTIG
jgi:transcription initiation factor IIE alpha subunit